MTETIRAWAQSAPGERLEELALRDDSEPTGHEVDIAVEHCSVCHSDLHLIDGDWGEVARPLVAGHEIVGRVLRKGALARQSVGERVGVGWQAGSCGHCAQCVGGKEHLCTVGKVRTCVGRQGGFASRVRVDGRFAFVLSEKLEARTAGPLLCAGLTVFSPMERFSVGVGVRVGVVGLGGLGHVAVQFAKKLGASVVAFDKDLARRSFALSLGAEELLDASGALPERAVDLLLVTTHANLDWNAWMNVLDIEGNLCLIGVPSKAVTVAVDPLLDGQKTLTGSVIGSPATMRRMLDFATENRVKPITEHMPMAKVNDALDRVRAGEARLRVVLDADG